MNEKVKLEDIVSLAKREEEVFVPGRTDPIELPRGSEGNQLLQRVRDEAHRFAITHHRQRRDKQLTSSVLDTLPGVGPVRVTHEATVSPGYSQFFQCAALGA